LKRLKVKVGRSLQSKSSEEKETLEREGEKKGVSFPIGEAFVS